MPRRLVALLLLAAGLHASEELAHRLSRIFATEDFAAKSFGPARWIESGDAYTTVEPAASNPDAKEIVRYDTVTGRRTVLISAAQLTPPHAEKPLSVDDYSWDAAAQRVLIFTESKKVWRLNTRGDYWVLDRRTGALKKLGGSAPASSLMFAKFSPDGARVAYVRGNNLYVEDIASGAIHALTSDGSETSINGTSDWVYEEELNLRDGYRWSPDGRSIAYWHFDSTGVQQFTLINNTDSLYPKLTVIPYPKTGTTNSAVRIGVVSAKGGKTKWMNVPGDPRQNYLFRMDWAGNSRELAIGQLNRLQNTATVYLAQAVTGRVTPFFRDSDKAWADVPEVGIAVAAQETQWLEDGKSLLWLSERDGWRHAWIAPRDGGEPRVIATGNSDIAALLTPDPKSQWIYYTASPENATQTYLYRARIDGIGVERLTPADQAGSNSYNVSPDCRWAFHTHSRFDEPPSVDLVELPGHRVIRTLEENSKQREAVKALHETPVEFFHVSVTGATLDGWLLKPRDFDPAKKYPLVVYVYGEPAAVTVTDSWPGNRGLFERALADDGFLVASFENRGTPALKGREWRKSVYGAVGVLATEDQTEAVRALAKERPYIDESRIGVWGWSGGATNTLNLMFHSPDVFKVGVAVAPVPDQRLYDTIYQERYMGTPEGNEEGYRKGSAINFAEGLKGKLLLIHGSGDDNVHFQGSQRLINRLIELGKPFDFMEYPNRSHAISEGKGTSLHIYSLIARYFEDNLK